jgi:GH24 family phage-related lysozyme (muramidase)
MSNLGLQLIIEEEGPQKPHAYRDSRGLWTIARGCLVDGSVVCEGLCQAAMDAQDAHDLARAKAFAAYLPGFQRCSEVRQAVLESMCFQLGALQDWPHFRAALAMGDYNAAADNMIYDDVSSKTPSNWVEQTPIRCKRAAWMMRNNVWLAHGEPLPGSLET